MLNLNLAQQKLVEYYGKNVRESVIFMNQKQVQMLVETDKSYDIVLITDHTNLPIGNVDVLIQQKILKTGDTLEEMTALLTSLHNEIEKGYSQIETKLNDVIKDMKVAIQEGNNLLPLTKDRFNHD
ncbi:MULTISPECIES: hypothetical protein [Bacillaceae]|uniref:hypothetical protein n=1 Tax=Bacillaceae TaxID=186817 RepID=UPI000BFDFC60|nr:MULTISPECIES: hypothetical protein [Bacillaceae]MCM3164712.1 hypothetical protein [Metabacillus litoralis]PGT81506.1 hypothetical protein COD11_17395 [Bacillus sp. AFS040349]UGB33607.1 hypothetical protein LPC09_27115 [Metabacillus sp. B2-18]